MKVHVHISYRELEELCYAEKEYGEVVVYCDDYNNEIEIDHEEAVLDFQDLEYLIDEYLDDVLKIMNKKYRNEIQKLLEKVTV
ncbi:hypothetical protein [Saccharolobus islandicus]|uniref:hypothetical protein n=1 Tax=Saccharolobus islandicus TaxID=43080 RepID=UPI0003736ADB|nr:hypothetical protein [Sulfolobus islandicus]